MQWVKCYNFMLISLFHTESYVSLCNFYKIVLDIIKMNVEYEEEESGNHSVDKLCGLRYVYFIEYFFGLKAVCVRKIDYCTINKMWVA